MHLQLASGATWRHALRLCMAFILATRLCLATDGKKGKIGPGCKWTVPDSNIVQFSYVFTTGRAPSYRDWQNAQGKRLVRRSPAAPSPDSAAPSPHMPASTPGGTHKKPKHRRRDQYTMVENVDSADRTTISGATKGIVLRASSGNTGADISSASCPKLSTAASLESDALKITNQIDSYYQDHPDEKLPIQALVLWGGLQNSDPTVGSDLQQAIFFQGAGCNANPQTAWCLFAAQENVRYVGSNMCYSSRFPVAYTFKEPAHVIYKSHVDFRSQEVWVGDLMFAYLRSEGVQVMNQIEFTQECIDCAFPMNDQSYDAIQVTFEQPVDDLSLYGACWGGAVSSGTPQATTSDKRQWTIPKVVIPPMTGQTFYDE